MTLKVFQFTYQTTAIFGQISPRILITGKSLSQYVWFSSKKSQVAMKSPSDSTLLNDSSTSSDSSTETDEGADVQSPPLIRRPDIALVPLSRVPETREGEMGSTGDSSQSAGARAKRNKRKKNGGEMSRTLHKSQYSLSRTLYSGNVFRCRLGHHLVTYTNH